MYSMPHMPDVKGSGSWTMDPLTRKISDVEVEIHARGLCTNRDLPKPERAPCLHVRDWVGIFRQH
jgi:hypothetical protein